MKNESGSVSVRKGHVVMRTLCALVGASLVLSVVACGGGGADAGGGGSGDRFAIDYRSSARALLDLRVKADLRFSGKLPGVPGTLANVRIGQAHAQVRGNGQQTIDLISR